MCTEMLEIKLKEDELLNIQINLLFVHVRLWDMIYTAGDMFEQHC